MVKLSIYPCPVIFCLYIIKPGKFLPPSGKTIARYQLLSKNILLSKRKIYLLLLIINQKEEKIIIDASHIKYDARKKYIHIDSYTIDELGDLRNKLQCT